MKMTGKYIEGKVLKETEPWGGEASRRDQSEFYSERVGRGGSMENTGEMREASALGTEGL